MAQGGNPASPLRTVAAEGAPTVEANDIFVRVAARLVLAARLVGLQDGYLEQRVID